MRTKLALTIGCAIFLTCGSIAEAAPGWLAIAQQEIGHGETTGDNKGPDVRRYLRGSEGQSWCAAFVSWCMGQAGTSAPYLVRARNFLKAGTIVQDPRPGDIAVFWRGSRTATTGHVGIVESVNGTRITTIEGNVGEFPAKVKRIIYEGTPEKLLAFVRICG